MNFLNFGKRTSETVLYAMEAGRSMVEMLGVLAIIGVLSVGAITGYQKAMMKYKLNKHAEDLNFLIYNFLQLKNPIKIENLSAQIYMGETLKKLGYIPTRWTYINSQTLHDQFGSTLTIFRPQSAANYWGGIAVGLPSQNTFEVCQNILNAAKENSSSLFQLVSYNNSTSEYGTRYYGDSYCGQSLQCLNSLNMSIISDICHSSNSLDSSLYLMWK